MDTSTLDFNTLTLLVTLLVAIMGSTLTIVSLMFRQFNRHEESIRALNTNVAVLDTKVDALDTKVTALEGKVDAMGRDVSDSRERLARVEGHLLAPEGFTLREDHQGDPRRVQRHDQVVQRGDASRAT